MQISGVKKGLLLYLCLAHLQYLLYTAKIAIHVIFSFLREEVICKDIDALKCYNEVFVLLNTTVDCALR